MLIEIPGYRGRINPEDVVRVAPAPEKKCYVYFRDGCNIWVEAPMEEIEKIINQWTCPVITMEKTEDE